MLRQVKGQTMSICMLKLAVLSGSAEHVDAGAVLLQYLARRASAESKVRYCTG